MMSDVPGNLLDQVAVGDTLEFLRELPTGCAGLVVADPPYNLGPGFSVGKQWQRDQEWLPWCKEWLTECRRILSDDGNIFVYGIHHYLCYLQVAMYDLDLQYRRQVIWYYENGWAGYNRSLAAHYEPILWFSKSESYTFHEIREPYKSTERLKHKIVKNGKVWTPNPGGRMAGDVWRFPVLAGRRFRDEKVDHPAQKPLALSNRIIKHFSNEGDLVVVPFAGSGTECVSAKAAGRHFASVDINPAYVDIARARLDGTVWAEALGCEASFDPGRSDSGRLQL
jgi:DNA modification methylase